MLQSGYLVALLWDAPNGVRVPNRARGPGVFVAVLDVDQKLDAGESSRLDARFRSFGAVGSGTRAVSKRVQVSDPRCT